MWMPTERGGGGKKKADKGRLLGKPVLCADALYGQLHSDVEFFHSNVSNELFTHLYRYALKTTSNN